MPILRDDTDPFHFVQSGRATIVPSFSRPVVRRGYATEKFIAIDIRGEVGDIYICISWSREKRPLFPVATQTSSSRSSRDSFQDVFEPLTRLQRLRVTCTGDNREVLTTKERKGESVTANFSRYILFALQDRCIIRKLPAVRFILSGKFGATRMWTFRIECGSLFRLLRGPIVLPDAVMDRETVGRAVQ